MSTYLERLQEIEAIEQAKREAAAAVAQAKRILDNKTCPCAFCVQRREAAAEHVVQPTATTSDEVVMLPPLYDTRCMADTRLCFCGFCMMRAAANTGRPY